jgi:hypothetical protein
VDEILQLTGNRREVVVALDARGKPVFRRIGGPEGIAIDAATIRRLHGQIDLITHNHPLGTPVSDVDVAFTFAVDAREVDAFDEAVRWRFVRRGDRWPPPDAFFAEVDHLAEEVRTELQSQIDADELELHEAERRFYALLWPRLERRHPAWFTFHREER